MTVGELMEELQKYQQDAEVLRVITAEYGDIEVQTVRLSSNEYDIVID